MNSTEKAILKEKRISLNLPGSVVKNVPYYFRNDQEIKDSIVEFIIPNTWNALRDPNSNGLPFTSYTDYFAVGGSFPSKYPLGSTALKFYICLAEVGDNNKFLFWNIPIAAFANGRLIGLNPPNQESLAIEVKANIDLGKSYIFAPQNIEFLEEIPGVFDMLLRYRN